MTGEACIKVILLFSPICFLNPTPIYLVVTLLLSESTGPPCFIQNLIYMGIILSKLRGKRILT